MPVARFPGSIARCPIAARNGLFSTVFPDPTTRLGGRPPAPSRFDAAAVSLWPLDPVAREEHRVLVIGFDETRPVVVPHDAATLILVRDVDTRGSATAGTFEVCVMQRSHESRFMGGAVVFPGGRVEVDDSPTHWPASLAPRCVGEWWDDQGISARIAACREALEEVGIVPLLQAEISDEHVCQLRDALTLGSAQFRERLGELGHALDLASLLPIARWVTPLAESRRFDTRFFILRAPPGQQGSIDQKEAIRTFWAAPAELLRSHDSDKIVLLPPTHRMLELLASCASSHEALSLASTADLEEICPRFVLEEGVPILALPGDPLHEVRSRRIAGRSRYALREARWCSEDPAPASR